MSSNSNAYGREQAPAANRLPTDGGSLDRQRTVEEEERARQRRTMYPMTLRRRVRPPPAPSGVISWVVLWSVVLVCGSFVVNFVAVLWSAAALVKYEYDQIMNMRSLEGTFI